MKIENVEAVNEKLQALLRINPVRPSVVVGYTAAYAIYVHENMEAKHTNGQAKFLEQPARQLPLGRMIADLVARGTHLDQALLMAGMRLQRESQKLAPVLTGALKNSAFTKLE